jgi:hypothetical protein
VTRIPPALRDTVPYVLPRAIPDVSLPVLPRGLRIGPRRRSLLREPWVHVVLVLGVVVVLRWWLGFEVSLP